MNTENASLKSMPNLSISENLLALSSRKKYAKTTYLYAVDYVVYLL